MIKIECSVFSQMMHISRIVIGVRALCVAQFGGRHVI